MKSSSPGDEIMSHQFYHPLPHHSNPSNHHQLKTRTSSLNRYVLAAAVLASTNSILLGYDIGVMSGAVLFIRESFNITSTQVELLVGCLNVCSLIGSLASGKTSDMIGRRRTIVLASLTFLAGALVMGLAPSFTLLMAGRVIAGIGVGCSLMIAPVYNAELSPAMARGFLSSLPEVLVNLGILLGYISNYVFATLPVHVGWRLMLGVAALPALFVAIGVLVMMPESPRWLVMQGRLVEAREVLMKTCECAQEAEVSLSGMRDCDRAERGHGGAWRELILRPSPPIRRVLIVAIGINFFMQASGNDAIVYYSPEVFKEAGVHDKKHLLCVTILMGLAKTIFALFSALSLDRFGRRPLLLLGSVGMALSLFGLGLGSLVLQQSVEKPIWAIVLCVVAVCADVSFFSIGLGPITWVYSSEIFPSRLRAQGTSLAVSINRLTSGIVSMTFLSISESITFGGMLFVFSGIMAVGAIFFYFFLPETKGKPLEEVGTLFEDVPKEHNKILICS